MLFTDIKNNETHVHIVGDCLYRGHIGYTIALKKNDMTNKKIFWVSYANSSTQILSNNLPFNTKRYKINKGPYYRNNIALKINYTKKIPYGTIVQKKN